MQWFGQSWDAPVCHPIDHVPTPVDELCIFCPRSIKEDDQGFAMPHATGYSSLGTREVVVVFAHRDCLIRSICGPPLQPPS